MYRTLFVDAHLAKIALWFELMGRELPIYIIFRSKEAW